MKQTGVWPWPENYMWAVRKILEKLDFCYYEPIRCNPLHIITERSCSCILIVSPTVSCVNLLTWLVNVKKEEGEAAGWNRLVHVQCRVFTKSRDVIEMSHFRKPFLIGWQKQSIRSHLLFMKPTHVPSVKRQNVITNHMKISKFLVFVLVQRL